MTFRREGGACLSSTVRKKSQNWFAFSTDENSETLETSAIKNGRSMLAMFLTVIISSNNIPVNDMTAPVIGLINDLDKATKTKSIQSLLG